MFTFVSKLSCRRILFRALLIAIMGMLPAGLLAQAYFGTVGGLVTDPTGAVVQGAKIVLTDLQKGYKFNAATDVSGRYLFRSIPPGLYSVSAEMSGFEKTVRTDLRLDINENATANLTLKIATSKQTVEVQAQAQSIATKDAATGQVINRKFINDLPLIDRYVMDLAYLTPGVTEMDDQCKTCGGTNFVSNGSRGATADILMDGASITNFEPNGGVTEATYMPSPEAVEEFKIEQSNFSAEYGFSGGSIINMVTRSGTNAYHGSAYDFLRNQALDANNWFNNLWGNSKTAMQRNDYGGTVGGPIIKNKTFFFFDYEGTRSNSMGTYEAGFPSAVERNGDFGEVCTGLGGTFDENGQCTVAAGQIWDPYTGTYDPSVGGAVRSTFIPYNNLATYTSPGNANLNGTGYQLSSTAGNLIDPVAQKMMNFFPLPNMSASAATLYRNWSTAGAYHGYNDQFDLKIDHSFSAKNMISAKYSRNWNHGKAHNCFDNFTDPCQGGPNTSTANAFTINDTYTLSPTLLLNTTLGITRGAMTIDAYNSSSGVSDPLSELGFPSYLQSNGFNGVPAIFIGGGYYSASSTSIGDDPWGNYRQGKLTGQLGATLSMVKGAHEVKIGFEGRVHQQNYIQTNAPLGQFGFDEHGSGQCPNDVETCGGDAMASFLMGQMNGDTYYEIQMRPATENYQYAMFVQDNWKVRPRLSLNIGFRYDLSLPRTDRYNHQNWIDLNAESPLSGETSLGTLYGGDVFASAKQRSIVNKDWKDLQPRFGFAYQFRPTTVVRGGYGIYYSQTRSGATGVAPYGADGYNVSTSPILTYNKDGATPYLHLSNPYPFGLVQPVGSSLGLATNLGFGISGPLRNVTATPQIQSWSLGVEHQLPWHTLIDVEYIGKKGTHLYYGGANSPDHLGPQIEKYTSDQIEGLNTLVDNPFYGIITDPNSGLAYSQVWEGQLELPYPQFTGIGTEVPPVANSIYNALQIRAEKRYSNGLQFLVSYTWSKSIDDASVDDDNVTWLGSFLSLQNPNNLKAERSLSTFDIPSVLQFTYVYDLPVGKGKAFLNKMPPVLEAIVGGWKTNGVWRISGGRPLAMSTYDGTALPTYGGQRPNIVGTPKRNYGKDWYNNYFTDPNVFQLPEMYTLGDAPRTIGGIRTPLAFNADLSMEKDFSLERLRHDMQLEFRLEARNALNHPVFGTPDTSVDDPSFGTIGYTSNGPREMQVGMKILF